MGKLSDNISSIYNDYNPAFRNLYKVEIYPGSSESATDDIKTYIGLHATTISFNGETLNLERNEVTKNFQLSSSNTFQRTDELTITWREDEDWKIKKYHDGWLTCFYDKEKDYFISYPLKSTDIVKGRNKDELNNYNTISRDNLTRTIRVYLPDHLGDDQHSIIEFRGVLPKLSVGIDLAWSSSSEIVTHTITYYVKEWSWVTEGKNA